jgi:hypothetical protein
MKSSIEYLSYSRLILFERSPEAYYRRYILGEKTHSKYMDFGKWFAELLESEKKSDDMAIERLRSLMPKYSSREEEITVNYKGIPILVKPDGIDWRKKIIGEFKTGKKWTQKMADESIQITLNAMAIWIEKKEIFKTQLHWIETEEDEDGSIIATGYGETFKTNRTVKDFLLLWTRIERAWVGINKIHQEAYARI